MGPQCVKGIAEMFENLKSKTKLKDLNLEGNGLGAEAIKVKYSI